jgi:drug/metabolite transporter (DMT)-like permease
MSDDVIAPNPGLPQPRDGAGLASSPAATSHKQADPRIGYYFAALNAIVSGFAIFVNSMGVKMFADSTLYTTLKNCVVGVALLIPFLVLSAPRRELMRLTRKQWTLLLLIALIGGSFSYALDFRGLQISTAATSAVVGHTGFLFVAVFAAVTIGERFGRAIWVALLVLFVGLSFGISVKAIRMDAGVWFLLGGAAFGAAAAVLIKVALRTVSIMTVMAFKMTLGALLLVAYVAATGRLGEVTRLSSAQWGFVLVTGLILLAFTVTLVIGLNHASATGVNAISAGSPIITTLLVVFTRHTPLATATLLGLGLVLVAVLMIFTLGRRQEIRDWQRAQSALAAQKAVIA